MTLTSLGLLIPFSFHICMIVGLLYDYGFTAHQAFKSQSVRAIWDGARSSLMRGELVELPDG